MSRPQVFHDVTKGSAPPAPPSPTSYGSPGTPRAGTRTSTEAFTDGMARAARELDIPRLPASLIGVSILYEPGILIEAEATAVVT